MRPELLDALAALDRPIKGIIEHDLYPTTPDVPLPENLHTPPPTRDEADAGYV